MMIDFKHKKSSKDMYFALCKNTKNVKPDDVKSLMKTVYEELMLDFESDLLNLCYSTWQKHIKKIRIPDCQYLPYSFSVKSSDESDNMSEYDAYLVVKVLAKLSADEDISTVAVNWIEKYLGKPWCPSHARENDLDAYLKVIDEGLIADHRKCFKFRNELVEQEPTAKYAIKSAKAEANEIVKKAKDKASTILADADGIKKKADKLRQEGEQAARKCYDMAEAAERQRSQQAKRALEGAEANAKQIVEEARAEANEIEIQAQQVLDDAKARAEKTDSEAKQKAKELIDKAQADANKIKQAALNERYTESNKGLKEGMNKVTVQFGLIQEAMRELEAQFAQAQLMKFFNTFHSLYDLIDVNKNMLQLPEEYSYIGENMDEFLNVIQEGLADFGIETVISEPRTPFNGKLHDVQGNAMFDPAKAVVKCTLRPGFVNKVTGNVLEKERIEIIVNKP